MKAALTLPLILIMVTMLPGCGGSDSADGVRSQPNSFSSSENPIDDFSDNSTGDSSNTVGLAANEVRVTLEVPGSIAPEGQLTRRNLRIVAPDQVRVYRTNNSLQELSSVNIQQRTEAN